MASPLHINVHGNGTMEGDVELSRVEQIIKAGKKEWMNRGGVVVRRGGGPREGLGNQIKLKEIELNWNMHMYMYTYT